jgi:hypothetical protein
MREGKCLCKKESAIFEKETTSFRKEVSTSCKEPTQSKKVCKLCHKEDGELSQDSIKSLMVKAL